MTLQPDSSQPDADRLPWRRAPAAAVVLALAVGALVFGLRAGDAGSESEVAPGSWTDPFGLYGDKPVAVPRNEILRGAAKDGIPALFPTADKILIP